MKVMTKSSLVCPTRWLSGACSILMIATSQIGWAQQAVNGATAAPSTGIAAAMHSLGPAPLGSSMPGEVQRPAVKEVASEEEETAAPQKPGTQAIKVHGHWIIDVKNPDGTVVEHRDFYNSLASPNGGDEILTQLLLGRMVAGDFLIQVPAQICNAAGIVLAGPLTGPGTEPGGCEILSTGTGPSNQDSGSPYGQTYSGCSDYGTTIGLQANVYGCASGLTVSYMASNTTTTPPAPAGITLRGSITAVRAGTITSVTTGIGYCTTNGNYSEPVSSSACQNVSTIPTGTIVQYGYRPFTTTTLPASGVSTVPVVTGQTVLIVVNLTFS